MKFIFVVAFLLSIICKYARIEVAADASVITVDSNTFSKTTDKGFGNIAVGTSLGTEFLATTGSWSSTGGVILKLASSKVSTVAFTVSGTSDYTFSITLPTSTPTIDENADLSMFFKTSFYYNNLLNPVYPLSLA